MGIYDRDYSYQERPPGLNLGGPRLMVTNIVLFTVGVYILQLLTRQGDSGTVQNLLELHLDFWKQPWQVYQFLTYGFVHDPTSVMHILFNMLILWFLGREVEAIYGGKRLLQFYLSTIFLGGLAWFALENAILMAQGLSVTRNPRVLLGASGGVVGVATIFVMHNPRRTILLMLVIPMPVWLLAVLFVAQDVYRLFARDSGVAASVHLVGAALGYLFYRTQWQLGNFWPAGFSLSDLKPKPKLRVHDPDQYSSDGNDKMSMEVDRILEKIQREGQDSLTRKERKAMEDASRHYRKRGR